MTPRADLLALLQRVPAAVVAARCGVSARAVRFWASGERNPSRMKKIRVGLASYRIDVRAWRSQAAAAR